MTAFGILEEERLNWRKVGMRTEDMAWIEETTRSLKKEPIRLEFVEEVSAA